MNTPNKQSVWIFFSSILVLFDRGVRFLFDYLIRPKKLDEDSKRKEFILNIILIGTIILAFASNLSVIYGILNNPSRTASLMLIVPGVLLLTFVGLLVLSRKGRVIPASYVLLFLYFIASTYLIVYWGADLPQAILTYALIIIMSGILISSWFGIIATICVIASLLVVSWLQVKQLVIPSLYWRNEFFAMNDAVIISVTYLVVMIISWLYTREIDKSLQRARHSEFELKQQRDLLEIKVEERTRELRQVELQKIYELSQFAEFGRLSLGFFHDLINPLNALLLNIIALKNTPGAKLGVVEEAIDRSFHATKKMEEFMLKIKKQLHQEQGQEIFFLDIEITEVVQLLNYKIKEAGVEVEFNKLQPIQFYGPPIKFRQLIMNLICNAIESYHGIERNKKPREVIINLQKIGTDIKLEVMDFGIGIPEAQREFVFQPFYTTKSAQQGIGIGLATVKNIVDRELKGKIEINDNNPAGSIFTVIWPQVNPSEIKSNHENRTDNR